MTRQVNSDVAAVIADEVTAIEAGPDTPIPGSARISRGNGRSRVLQIRLNPEELAELERLAEERGLPTSTVAREAIIRLIRPEVARTESEKRLIDSFAQYVATLGAADGSTAG
jgi:predicted transcriptional regulator